MFSLHYDQDQSLGGGARSRQSMSGMSGDTDKLFVQLLDFSYKVLYLTV